MTDIFTESSHIFHKKITHFVLYIQLTEYTHLIYFGKPFNHSRSLRHGIPASPIDRIQA